MTLWLCLAATVMGQLSGIIPPPHTVWWEHPAARTGDTVLLWHFDTTDLEQALDAIMADTADPLWMDRNDPIDGTGSRSLKPVLSGTTQPVPDGYFDEGLTLGRDGSVSGEPGDLADLARRFLQASLECFVRLDRMPDTDTTLLRVGDSLRLVWRGDRLAVLVDETEILTHPVEWTVGEWHQVALHVVGNDKLGLSVDGHQATIDRRTSEPLAQLLRGMGRSFTIGPGFEGTIDAVQVELGPRHLYAKRDRDLRDPERERDVLTGPPFFVTQTPLLARDFDDADGPPGVRGQALAAQSAPEPIAPADALLQPQGSLAFWFQPQDWNNFYRSTSYEPDFRWLPVLLARNPKNHAQTHTVVSFGQGYGGHRFTSGTRLETFHPGRWVHVVLAWGPYGGIYLNGERQEFSQVGFNRNLPRAAREEGWELVLRPSGTVIDEVAIYPYALHRDEAWNAWRRYYPDSLASLRQLPAIEATFAYTAEGWTPGQSRLNVALRCLPINETLPASARMQIMTPDGEPHGEPATIHLDAFGIANTNLPVRVPFGIYPVTFTSQTAEGHVLAAETIPFDWSKPEWYGNPIGRDRFVPPPWTPIEVVERHVRVWGRTIALGSDGLPAAVEALDRAVLAAPVRIHGEAGGQAFDLDGDGVTFSELSDDRVAWQATAGGPDGIDTEVSAWMEYDGLIYYTVRLRRADGTDGVPSIDRLWVDIPLNPDETSQLIANGGGGNFRASYDIRFIPDGEGRVWNSRDSRMQKGIGYGSFLPQIWVGGDHVGLSISGDNDQGWTPDLEQPAQELRREDGRVVFRMNVITRPVHLESERTFTFILLPTPAKPMPTGWRAWNRAPRGAPLSYYENIDDFNGYPMTSKIGEAFPLSFRLEPESWEAAAHWSAIGRRQAGEHNPVLKYINYSWPSLGPSLRPWLDGVGAGGRIAWTPELTDYYVWIVAEYIRRGLIDGVYIDDVSMGTSLRLDATAYEWTHPETGKLERRRGFNTMGFRRFLQRIYKTLVLEGKTPRIVPHMTWCFELPAFSFCDAILNGEDRDIVAFNPRDYIDTFNRAEMRIMGNSPKWGTPVFWKWSVRRDPPGGGPPRRLPEDKVASWMYRQARAGDAWLPQHDLWYFWRDSRSGVGPAMVGFGLDDPELAFIPYWESTDVLRVTGGEGDTVIAGIWRRADRALIMVSNLEREDQTVTLEPDVARLFGATPVALSWRDVDPHPIPPPPPVEATSEAAAAARELDMGDGLDTRQTQLLADLDPFKPPPREDQEAARLALEPDGNTLTLLVRGRDYRILVLEIAEPGE